MTFSVPSLITRTTNDITQMQMIVAMGLQMMIKAPIMAVWARHQNPGQELGRFPLLPPALSCALLADDGADHGHRAFRASALCRS